jgi:hypothetical protein
MALRAQLVAEKTRVFLSRFPKHFWRSDPQVCAL